MKEKIIFFDDVHPYIIEYLRGLGFECMEHFNTDYEEILKVVEDADGLVGRSRFQLDRSFLSFCSKLKFIARYGVGTDHIDLEYANQRGIEVITSPEGSADTVAEHTVGMILSVLNNLQRADRQVREGKWLRESNRGIEIKNKTIGILGYGNMGSAVAKRLSGFQSKVIAFDKYKTNYGDEFAKEVGLEEFFRETDILSIHIPYTPENHYFINDLFISSFKKNIFIFNLARGWVLHTDDLVKNLKSGKVLGAGLDVLEYEEGSFSKLKDGKYPPAMQYLFSAENILLTPHIGGWSYESLEGHARVLASKIENFYFN